MKKRVSMLGLLLVCILGLTACGQKVDPAAAEREAAKNKQIEMMGSQYSLSLLNDFMMNHDEGKLEESLGQNDEMDKLINSYLSGMEDVGHIQESADELKPVVKIDKKNVIVDIDITGDLEDANGNPRKAVVEMMWKSDFSAFPDLAVNPVYTKGELMTKAGLNTLLGMGVTFTILILISLIISSFTLIGKFQDRKKNEKETDANASVDNAVKQIVAGEEQADDGELIAVISAAIAAYEAENGYASADGVVVRSIRKINKNKWQRA